MVANDKLTNMASYIRVVIVVQAILLLTAIIILADVKLLLFILATGIGWYAIYDPVLFKPIPMQIYFVACIIGSYMCSIQAVVWIVKAVQKNNWSICWIIALFTAIVLSLITGSRLSWLMFKEMLQGPSFMMPSQGGGTSGYVAGYASDSNGANENPNANRTADGYHHNPWSPFSGGGRRLGG